MQNLITGRAVNKLYSAIIGSWWKEEASCLYTVLICFHIAIKPRLVSTGGFIFKTFIMSETSTMYKKPDTISEISDFLSKAINKVMGLNASSFGKFTPDHLSDDYLYQKWIGKEKDFTDVYLNMDSGCQVLFIKYVLGEEVEHDYYLAALLHRFFLFCWNWDSPDFTENPFAGKYADFFNKSATGKKNPMHISSMQVLNMFYSKLEKEGRKYLTWCVFGVKR